MKTLLHIISRERASRNKAITRRTSASAYSKHAASIRVALVVLFLAPFSSAQILTGKVSNLTIGKPSAGDEVVVFKLSKGMEESGRAKTDTGGRFSFKLDDLKSPYLVRAIHQGVTYHRVVLPGMTSVAIEVYDVAQRVESVQVVADIMRIQTTQGHILVTRDFGVRNASNPPRTQMNERNLEFYVPDHAHVLDNSATATSENGKPVRSAAVPEAEKNRYSFVFPLRPGFTHFEVEYELPYSGSANLDPKSIYPLRNFVVILPKAIQFRAAAGSTRFKLMNFPNQRDASVRTAANTKGRQNLAFSISGQGTLDAGGQSATQRSRESKDNLAGSAAPRADSTARAGGGLGPPIAAPDPLQMYRSWILVGSAAVLLIGVVFVAWRQRSKRRAFGRPKGIPSLRTPMPEEGDYPAIKTGVLEVNRASGGVPATSLLMKGIKEELFQIEMERKQGRISRAEYDKAKAALDQTLARALKREPQQA